MIRLSYIKDSNYDTIMTIKRIIGTNMTDNNVKKWIWQHDEYPHFKYDIKQLTNILNSVEYNRGLLDGVSQLFNDKDVTNIELETLLDEAISTSEIEGEVLKRDSVRASLLKKLSNEFDTTKDTSTHQTDGLVDILIDTSINKKPLTKERLHGWHNSLFLTGYSGLSKINIATFRDHDDMKVVSGAIGQEKVHYLAVPKDAIDEDIDKLLQWCNTSNDNTYIKSAIAHLWFVSIHPYDDGNGRIARAITDYILSKQDAVHSKFKLYSISMAINNDRRGYYEILDNTTNLFINRNFDFTPWLLWHLNILNNALLKANDNIKYVIQKTKFWDKHRNNNLNERQVKVLNKVLNLGAENFEGGINTKKYTSIVKKSKATVVRDIQELVEKKCIKQVEGTSGRNVRYEINFDAL